MAGSRSTLIFCPSSFYGKEQSIWCLENTLYSMCLAMDADELNLKMSVKLEAEIHDPIGGRRPIATGAYPSLSDLKRALGPKINTDYEKRDLNKVIELDRSYEDGGPDRVMGRVYFKLPGFAGGSKDKSLEHLEKSKEYGPEDVVTRLYLAETLLDHKRVEDARAELEYILNVPDDPRWVPAIQENKVAAQEMLKKKKFRK